MSSIMKGITESSVMKGIVDETDAIKGADGKRCWKGKRYAGTKNGKDICVPVKNESAARDCRHGYPEDTCVECEIDYLDRQIKLRNAALGKGGKGDALHKAIKQLIKKRNELIAGLDRYNSSYGHDLWEGVIVGHDANDPEVAILGGAGTMSLSNLKKKAQGEAEQLANDVARGRFKAAAYNIKQLANTLNTIAAAEEEMSKNYFGEDYTGEFAAEKTAETNPYGGMKDRQHRGAISETPDTSGPVGVQPGGWRRTDNPGLDEELSRTDVDGIERFADKLYKKLGIDVTFTKHFMDRVNDERNGKPISGAELVRLFKKEYERWGKDVAQLGPDMEGTFKDLTTDINLPFVLRWDRDEEELDLIAKTVMRKKNFKTHNKEFPVDEDTSFGTGMGQGGNAGESYRKFTPKSAGTFKESSIMKGITGKR